VGVRECAREAARRCPAAPRAGGAPLAPLRPSAAAARRCPAAGCRPSAARRACKPAWERAELWRWGGGVGAGGSHPPQAPATRHPPARRRSPACVCGAAAASRQRKMTALHEAAHYGHAPCVESLLKAGADASLKNGVSDGAEGRGGRRGGVGARGRARGGGEGPCSQAPRRLSAPRSPRSRPLPPRAAASTSSLPPPRLSMAGWRWTTPR